MPARKKTAEQLEAAGTARKDRPRVEMFPVLDRASWKPPVKPEWLDGDASSIWDAKVALYESRGQIVKGFESALAQYCALEATLVKAYRMGGAPQANLIQQHRSWCTSFFDTPASTTVTTSKLGVDNPFLAIARGQK